uniref:SDR family oxidoreductase n=1 Tax=candidate division WOR-3 bacterium TaxID=2052148 RepID=A0A7C4CA21_UNCW3
MKRSGPVAVVAGGAGFIGSHLCDFLIERGFRVICLDNLLTGRPANIAHLRRTPAFEFIRCDVTRPLRIPGRVDLVYNLASPASPRDFARLALEILAAGAYGTGNLLRLAREKHAVFVMASTSEVYGDPREHPQRETYRGNVNPTGPRSAYDEAKRYAEALVSAWHRVRGLPVRIARIFNTYGPRMRTDDGRLVPNLIQQALSGRPLTVYGSGRQTRSFCYVSDMVEGLFRLAGFGTAEPVNLGNPAEFTVLQLARLVLELTGSQSRIVRRPLPENDPKRRCPDIARARRLLGWRPHVPLRQGLRRTIEWFREQNP